jgi:protocatechuate 3,4-dioxygenase beta subunit
MRRLFHAALAAFAILFVPHAAGAQSTSGTISGTVTDESKGVLPGVAIEVVNADTGVTRSLVTGPDGRYQALSLPPGTYRVTAELSGFG